MTSSSGQIDDRAEQSTARLSGGSCEREPLAEARVRDPERYAILGEHGRGALGRVSRAHDKELGRDIAIKELIARGRTSETRFLREALITARLEHPGIVAVHEAGRWPDGTPFYAMKLVAGRPLRELIAERATVDERLGLLHHVIAVADAIAYAHGRNVIHRDLKPANVVVGDFGETIVIDWGLAKDLTAPEEPWDGDGTHRAPTDRELTATGTVLGTPAYMAPEQERGGQVDQRADVFAIGVMLWELCSHSRVLPAEAQGRYRALRSAGIDPDLATIIGKALDPDPGRRYPDAGALAHDLKAFKSGARIAARGYSVLGILAHLIRRHRTLAYSIMAVTALAVAGVVLFVRNIAVERDRADTALRHLEVATNDRLLEQVQLLLHTDPTAAKAALADYRGRDTVRARRLLAEAEGRGVARAVLAPHSGTVWFLHGDKTGAILSVGNDHRIMLTRGTTSTTLAADVSTEMHLAYAPARGLLAYATFPAGFSVLDLRTMTSRRISPTNPARLAFSHDGSRLAAVDRQGELRVWTTAGEAAEIYRAALPGAAALHFATPTRLIVLARSTLQAVALDATGGAPDVGNVTDVTATDTTQGQGATVLAGTSSGRLAVLSSRLELLSSTSVCRKSLREARFIPHTDLVAFACQDPVAGIARYHAERRELTVVDTFATRGLTQVSTDFAGRYVLLIDESLTAYVYEIATRLLRHYDGNAGIPSFVSAPTAELNQVLIGDVNGTIRVWDAPSGDARVAVEAPEAIFGLSFTSDSKGLVTGGSEGIVRWISTERDVVTELRGHSEVVQSTRAAPDGSTSLSFSYDGTVRTWRAQDLKASRVFAGHAGVVADVAYIERGGRVVSVGDDGRLLAWSPQGNDMTVLFQTATATPLTGVEALVHNDHVVIKDAKGAMWEVSPRGESKKVRDADGAAVTMLRASSGGTYVVTGTDTGVVTVYETSTWRVIKRVIAQGSIRQIQFDPRDRDLLIASQPGRAQFGHVQIVALGEQRTVGWREIAADARDVAYSPDGGTIGLVCSDGGVWLYTIQSDTWLFARDHDAAAINGTFSPDGRLFASSDIRGVVVVRKVASTPSGAVR